MAKLHLLQCLIVLLCAAMMFSRTSADTFDLDVQALRDLYISLNLPPQLTGWKAHGGDPCSGSWLGVACYDGSVLSTNISGLGITGTLGQQLSDLLSLKELDASFKSIQGEILFNLPPNATYINFAFNLLTGNIPSSLASMKYLTTSNLSHNFLVGAIGDIFMGLLNLKQLDLSYNGFDGGLRISFTTLTSLTVLSLQDNQFTGSVDLLADLPLLELNICNNHFTGVVPKSFQGIPKLSVDGNLFEIGVPLLPSNAYHNKSTAMNGIDASKNQSSSSMSDPSFKVGAHKHKRWRSAAVAAAGVAIFVVIVLTLICLSHRFQPEELPTFLDSFPSTTINAPSVISQQWPTAPPFTSPYNVHSGSHGRMKRHPRRMSSLMRSRAPSVAKYYSIAELLVATNGFTEDNHIRECPLGSVYKGMLINGKVVAVKLMHMMPLCNHDEDQFQELVWNMSSLRHPNIVSILGYCMENRQYLIVYEYTGHTSLNEALHFSRLAGRSLSWNSRVKIAVGVAEALRYLHLRCLPAIAHGNLKASNVLLDKDLQPHISDCGLAVLRPFTCNEIMASQLPSDGAAYTNTDNTEYDIYEYGVNTKHDIFEYGVLLLELLTGQKPFDSSRGTKKQSLVKWAENQLSNVGSLEEMVDPTIRGSLSTTALFMFTEAIRLCLQMEPRRRPPISKVAALLDFQILRTRHRGGLLSADGAKAPSRNLYGFCAAGHSDHKDKPQRMKFC